MSRPCRHLSGKWRLAPHIDCQLSARLLSIALLHLDLRVWNCSQNSSSPSALRLSNACWLMPANIASALVAHKQVMVPALGKGVPKGEAALKASRAVQRAQAGSANITEDEKTFTSRVSAASTTCSS